LGQAAVGVVGSYALGLRDPNEVADLNEAVIGEMVIAADRPEAQAIFLSCTNLPTVLQLDSLRATVGKPVLSSNLVTMWAALRAAGQVHRSDELLPLQ
jgi:maleate isomerase